MTTGGYESSVTGAATPYQGFAARLRARETLIGYWIALDSPVSTERIGRLGFDYVAFDAQHGLIGYDGLLRGLMAVDAGGRAVGVVRVGANDQYLIGRALDAGAVAVIVPLIDNAEQAARAIQYTRYAPTGLRSYGPMRSALRIGPNPAETHEQVAVLAMIETADGLANVEEICAVPGLAGVYIGPYDLRISLGGSTPTDPALAEDFEAALRRIREAAIAAGVAAGIHTHSGAAAAQRLAEGFTFVSIASDLTHLEAAAQGHLAQAQGYRA
jgi:4-hydroxy-2-oxoheptanedioate aldolase